jgi:aryl-alcohol dehydrogenase-like predicted oxidoreductase
MVMNRRATLCALGALAAGLAAVRPTGGQAMRFEARPIPRTGERIPAVGLGTWQSFDVPRDGPDRAAAKEALRTLAEHGGKVVDSSPMYGAAEEAVGTFAAELGLAGRLFVATKVWTTGREAGMRQMETSFGKLRVERLDLMQVHNLVDADTHLATLAAWKKAGRVRYAGVTHYHASAFPALEAALRKHRLEFVQFNYSLAEREAERRMLEAARGEGAAVIVNRPFAEGALFSRVRGKPLPAWARDIDCESWAQVFLKFILGHPAVTCVIPGTRNPKHVADNLGAARGRLPDAALRRRIAAEFDAL